MNFPFKSILTLTFCVLMVQTSFATPPDSTLNRFGKGISIAAQDGSFSMKFSTRFQQLFLAEMPENGTSRDVYSNFLIRRSRLKFDGHVFSPRLKYKIELGLSNRDIGGVVPQKSNTANIILDAVAKWTVAEYGNKNKLVLWAGQTKLPGNRERVISSQALQFVDRSLVNSRYNIDRDMGIQIRNELNTSAGVLRQWLAFSQGEGRNITSGNTNGGYQYTGRLEWLPFGKFTNKKGDYISSDLERSEKPKLAIGATYDFNNLSVRERSNLGSFVDDSAASDLNSIMVDLMFKYRGFSVMIEYIDKTGSDPILLAPDSSVVANFYVGNGINIQGGYLFKSNWEIAGRYTNIQPTLESGRPIQDMYTLGFSRYIVGHALKVQTDFSYLRETDQVTSEEEGEYMFRLQMEIAF